MAVLKHHVTEKESVGQNQNEFTSLSSDETSMAKGTGPYFRETRTHHPHIGRPSTCHY